MAIRELSEELKIVAQTELNEKPEEIQENIRIIKEWIAQEPHLHARTDDQWILSYLRGCKFSIQQTKEKIDYYYTLRTIAPKLFLNRDPWLPLIQDFLNAGYFLPFKTTKKSPQNFLVRFGADGINHIPLLGLLKGALMIYDIMVIENDYLIIGQNIIIDLQGMPLSRLIEFTTDNISVICSLKTAYPERVKNLIILNAPAAAHGILEIIKIFLGKKIGSRMIICPPENLEPVHKVVPRKLLPKEYGGDASIQSSIAYWKQKVEDYADWFQKDAVYGTDESKRIATKFYDDIFGYGGSFRKLNVD